MKIFVGYDSREDIAYQVCRLSLLKNSSVELDIVPIKQDALRKQGLYYRDKDPLASTEFTYTRFLTPYLIGYKGWALFCDCDFLWRGDVSTVMDYADHSCSVMVVKHDYRPTEQTKMDGCIQTQYPKKNWSSMMLLNCDHEDTKNLTVDLVNKESGSFLHQFKWTSIESIGSLPVFYNYLEGWHSKDDCPNPIAVHFTRGGPWFWDYLHVEYGDEWTQYAKEILNANT